MKICLVGDGNSVHLIRWAGWLRGRGHIVQMVSLTKDNDCSGKYDEYRYVPSKSGLFAYARRSLPIAKAVRDFQPELIHGHYLTGGGFYAVTSSTKIPTVVSAWGSDIYVDSLIWEKRQAIKYALRHAEVVMGDSNHILNEVRMLAPSATTKKVIFGIDTQLFKPQPIKHDTFTFLSVRATTKIYNPEIIVKAFEKADLDAILMMQEPMADSFQIKDYCKARPELDEKVVWYSRRTYEEMPALYNSCDCGISIPYSDSSSTAMNECMATGVPVLASYIPQNEEWIVEDGVSSTPNGFFWDDDYDSEMDDSLAKDMQRIYQMSSTERTTRGQLARKTIIEKADWNTEMLRAESIYKEVLDGSKR